MTNENCLFCKIAKGEIPAQKVYENEDVMAFLDINPVNAGHTLVIPKTHFEHMLETPKDVFLKTMEAVHFLSPIIKEATNADGINIGINTLPAAGQEVFHLHVHIMPRFEGDGHKHWSGTPYKTEEEMKTVADRIRKRLEQ